MSPWQTQPICFHGAHTRPRRQALLQAVRLLSTFVPIPWGMFRLLYAITQPARGCSQLPLCLYSATEPKVSSTCFACAMPPHAAHSLPTNAKDTSPLQCFDMSRSDLSSLDAFNPRSDRATPGPILPPKDAFNPRSDRATPGPILASNDAFNPRSDPGPIRAPKDTFNPRSNLSSLDAYNPGSDRATPGPILFSVQSSSNPAPSSRQCLPPQPPYRASSASTQLFFCGSASSWLRPASDAAKLQPR